MDKVDWSKAPSDAEAHIGNVFTKWIDGKECTWNEKIELWNLSVRNWSLDRYRMARKFGIEMRPDEWKEGEKRMEQIQQNGNDGAVYGELEVGQIGREARLAGIDKTLSERGGRYGDFPDNGRVAQELKRVMKSGRNSDDLRDFQREALEVIASKIARIVNGDPDYIDNWHDIIGYAKLVEIELEQEKGE